MITTKQFQLLTDIELVYGLMTDVYNHEETNGPAEPLCTVPGHQHKGLAAAALSHHDSILRPLGAEIMTGGGNEFYKKIGYQHTHLYGHYRKH